MSLTNFQREICRLISQHRVQSGESYVAGGVALNELTAAARISRDIDLFHDTAEAVARSWDADRELLEAATVIRKWPFYYVPWGYLVKT